MSGQSVMKPDQVAKSIRFVGFVILGIVMALTNPSRERMKAEIGPRYVHSYSLIFFSIGNAWPEPGSTLDQENRERAKRAPEGSYDKMPKPEMYIGIFGQVL